MTVGPVTAIAPRWVLPAGLLLLGAVWLAGCSSTGVRRFDPATLPPPKTGTRISVPHISQNDDYSCGTTAVAMALSFYRGSSSHPLDKDEAWSLSGSDKSFVYTLGHDTQSLDRLVRHYGYQGQYVNRLGLDSLKRLLSQGILVVLFVQPQVGSPATHALLAVGYVDQTQTLLVEDPADRKRAYGYGELKDYWKAAMGRPWEASVEAGYIIYPGP